MTDGPLQIPLIDPVVPFEDSHHLVSCNRHDAEVVNPRAPRIGDEGMPEIVKGGVAHARCAACPLKRMRDAGSMIMRGHLFRVRLPKIDHGLADEYVWAAHVSCSSFERACQCLVQRDESPFIGLGLA